MRLWWPANPSLPPSPQTLQRGLPRPVSIDKLPPPKAPSELEALSLRERAEAELLNELAALVQHDNVTHPPASDADAAGVLCLCGGAAWVQRTLRTDCLGVFCCSAAPAQPMWTQQETTQQPARLSGVVQGP